MGTPVLIIGESGNGKSTSLRNLNRDDCILIQSVRKPLPFRNEWKPWDNAKKSGSIVVSDNSKTICEAITYFPSVGRKIIIIDDYQYTMANEFLRRSGDRKSTRLNSSHSDLSRMPSSA